MGEILTVSSVSQRNKKIMEELAMKQRATKVKMLNYFLSNYQLIL